MQSDKRAVSGEIGRSGQPQVKDLIEQIPAVGQKALGYRHREKSTECAGLSDRENEQQDIQQIRVPVMHARQDQHRGPDKKRRGGEESLRRLQQIAAAAQREDQKRQRSRRSCQIFGKRAVITGNSVVCFA